MKKIMKWTGIAVGGLFGLALLAGVALYLAGVGKLTQTYPSIPVETLNIPVDSDALARGRHVAVIRACTRCHGEDLSGTMITNDPLSGLVPIMGAIPAANLTSGMGGIATSYTDTDWVRAIRHGVMPEGRGEVLMFDYSTMSDQDLGDLIAYLKHIPPVDTNFPEMSFGLIVPVVANFGVLAPAAERIDHGASRPTDATPGATVEYGEYLSTICTACHGNGIRSEVENWNREDFVRAVNTGVLPNGRNFGPTMSSATFREMTDTELGALWLYFSSAKP